MAPLSSEAQLLLAIARPSLDAAAQHHLRSLLESEVDWDFLHRLVSRHRLGMFLYKHLDVVAAPEVPRPVFMDLWRTFEENARRNARRVVELERVVEIIEGDGMPVAAYKGLVTAHELYGDIRLREFEDQDVLVRLADMPRVTSLLCRQGYRAEHDLSPAAEAALYESREQYHRVLIHVETGEKLEVHWKTDPRFQVEKSADAAWWDALPRITLRERPMRTFPPSEQLIILALHGTKHQGHRLGWLLEVAELIRRYPIDWQWIDDTITALCCRRRVLVSLALSAQWVGAVLPECITAMTTEKAIRVAANEISARLFTGHVLERQEFDRLRLELQLYDRWPQRLRHIADVTLTPTAAERAAHPLPRSLEFLYWPSRVMKLAVKYGRRARTLH